jgi:hypothetical protein
VNERPVRPWSIQTLIRRPPLLSNQLELVDPLSSLISTTSASLTPEAQDRTCEFFTAPVRFVFLLGRAKYPHFFDLRQVPQFLCSAMGFLDCRTWPSDLTYAIQQFTIDYSPLFLDAVIRYIYRHADSQNHDGISCYFNHLIW